MSGSADSGGRRPVRLKDALLDPKQVQTLVEEGGHRVLAQQTMLTTVSSEAWQKAMATVQSEPRRYYYRPERWILVAAWMALLDEVSVELFYQALDPEAAGCFRGQAQEAGCEGTKAEALALLGSKVVDMFLTELLSTLELEAVPTHRGFFKVGSFRALRDAALPCGGFKEKSLPPGGTTPVQWNVLLSALIALYSLGSIASGEYPQLLVVHLGSEVTGRTGCFAVSPWTRPYAAQAAWAAGVLSPGTRGFETFKRMSERLTQSQTNEEKMAVVRWAQDVCSNLVAWSAEVRYLNPRGDLTPDDITGGYKTRRLRTVCAKCGGRRSPPESASYQQPHQCPQVLPQDYYWLGCGIEARDPKQPEWLDAEWFCRTVSSHGSIRYAILQVLQEVRKLAEARNLTLDQTHLPKDPAVWLEELYERDRDGLREMASEYRSRHNEDWSAAVLIDR